SGNGAGLRPASGGGGVLLFCGLALWGEFFGPDRVCDTAARNICSGITAILADVSAPVSGGGVADGGLPDGPAAGALPSPGIGIGSNGACGPLPAASGDGISAADGAAAPSSYQPAACRLAGKRLCRSSQRPADAIPGVSPAGPVAAARPGAALAPPAPVGDRPLVRCGASPGTGTVLRGGAAPTHRPDPCGGTQRRAVDLQPAGKRAADPVDHGAYAETGAVSVCDVPAAVEQAPKRDFCAVEAFPVVFWWIVVSVPAASEDRYNPGDAVAQHGDMAVCAMDRDGRCRRMALPKNKAWLLKGCLLVSLILSGCGGRPLSEREIVRGV